MKKTVLLLSFLALISCAGGNVKKSSLNSAYEVEIVQAEGVSPVIGSDLEGAKKSALADSMKNALALVVGVYVSADTLVSKSMLINDDITSKSEGYIEKYKVLKEYRDGEFYKVKIEAHVRKEDIAAKLKNLETEVEKIGNPVVFIKIREKLADRDIPGDYAGGELTAKLRQDGFRITSKEEEADIKIIGQAVSRYNTDAGLGGFISYSGSLSAEIKAQSGEIISAVSASAGGLGLNEDVAGKEALLNCARKAYDKTKTSVIDYYKQKRIITFKISGLKSLNDVNEIIRYFRNIPSIKDSMLKKYSDGFASIEILMRRGNSSELLPVFSKSEKFEMIKTQPFEIEAKIKGSN
ncbi:MAG: hypothetical protein GX447_03895 [Elusimicrobia bacterium]|nr:hypothetical protein [Elusimicrobiota bacterium]